MRSPRSRPPGVVGPQRIALGSLVRLAPVVLPVAVLSGAALLATIAGSVGLGRPAGNEAGGGGRPTLAAYRAVLGHPGFPASFAFTVVVASVGTAVAVVGGLVVGFRWCERGERTGRAGSRGRLRVLQLDLAVPHLVWAVALVATFSASGWLARVAAVVGLVDGPAQFPALVNDRWGLGIIGHIVTKEVPFVVFALLPLSGAATRDRLRQAALLGAAPWQRFRLVYLAAVLPAAAPAGLAVFAFSVGSYEPAAVLGVEQPRALAVVALDRFRSPDLAQRAEGFAISTILLSTILLATVLVAAGLIVAAGACRPALRWRPMSIGER